MNCAFRWIPDEQGDFVRVPAICTGFSTDPVANLKGNRTRHDRTSLLAWFDPDELWEAIRRQRAGTRPCGRINEPTVLNAMDALMRRHRPELAKLEGGGHEHPA